MKTFLALNIVTAGILLAGCGTDKNGMSLDAVGPVPSQSLATAPPINGTLVVYSAYRRNAYFDSRDPYQPEYSSYQILTAEGKVFLKIQNNSGGLDQGPASVALVPGKYRVVARANGYGYVTVPVIVEANQNTVLHLEGGDSWPDSSEFNQTNAVHLPDGKVIGWKSTASF